MISYLLFSILIISFVITICADNKNDAQCPYVTADYNRHSSQRPLLNISVYFKYELNRVIAKLTGQDIMSSGYVFQTSIYDSSVSNIAPINSTLCLPLNDKDVFCEVGYEEWAFNADSYKLNVFYILDQWATFFEAGLDKQSKKLVLSDFGQKHCSNSMTYPLKQDEVHYFFFCGDYMPDKSLQCPGGKHKTTASTAASTTKMKTTKRRHNDDFNQKPTTLPAPSISSTKTVALNDQYVINCNSPRDSMEKLFCTNSTLNSTSVSGYLTQTKNAFDPQTAKPVDIYMMSFILEKAANVPNMTLRDHGQMYQLFDSLLQMPSKHFTVANLRGIGSTQRLLTSVDTLLRNSDHDLQLFNASNLAMQKHNTPKDCRGKISFGLADYGKQGFGWSENHDPVATIEIPTNIACNSADQKSVPMYFVAYRRTQLFTPPEPSDNLKLRSNYFQFAEDDKDDEIEESKIPKKDRCKRGLLPQNNQVMTATLLNQNSQKNGDKVMAQLRYKKDQVKTSLHGHQTVTWWNAEKGWSTEAQCKTKESDGYIIGECYHLTDFTLLIDGSETDPSLCNTGLSIFGILVNVISMISLLLLGIIQFINLVSPVKRRCYPIFYRVPWLRFRVELVAFQYTITLFFFYLFFTSFSDQKNTGGLVGCQIFAALVYFLLLCCIILTLFQAWRVLKLFAWSTKMDYILSLLTRDAVAVSVSIAVPILVCVVGFLADRGFFNRQDNFCWIRPTSVIFAVVIPLSVLVLNGTICSIIMVTRLYPNLRITAPIRRLVRTNSTMIARATKQKSRDRFFAILSVQFVLGLPWVFQYFTLFEPTATAWHYIFSFVNGSQGLTIFAMFLYRRVKAYRATNAATTTSAAFNTSTNVDQTDITNVQTQRRLTFSLSNEVAKNESVYAEINDE